MSIVLAQTGITWEPPICSYLILVYLILTVPIAAALCFRLLLGIGLTSRGIPEMLDGVLRNIRLREFANFPRLFGKLRPRSPEAGLRALQSDGQSKAVDIDDAMRTASAQFDESLTHLNSIQDLIETLFGTSIIVAI